MEKIVDCRSHCELIVRNKHKEEVARAKFDKRHIDKVAPLLWHMSSGGYPRNMKLRRNLHQVIMKKREGFEIDHIDGDKLNNLDCNLRYVTHAQNGRNLKLSKANKSGCRGVWWDKVTQSWQVKICYNYKQIFLGRYKSLRQAIRVRKEAEDKYYGEYTRRV